MDLFATEGTHNFTNCNSFISPLACKHKRKAVGGGKRGVKVIGVQFPKKAIEYFAYYQGCRGKNEVWERTTSVGTHRVEIFIFQ